MKKFPKIRWTAHHQNRAAWPDGPLGIARSALWIFLRKKKCTLDYFYTVYLKTCMYLIKNLKTWIFVVATMVQIEVCTVCTKICTITLLYNL